MRSLLCCRCRSTTLYLAFEDEIACRTQTQHIPHAAFPGCYCLPTFASPAQKNRKWASDNLPPSTRQSVRSQQSGSSNTLRRGTPRAGLAALGLKLKAIDLFAPLRERVRIRQKTVK